MNAKLPQRVLTFDLVLFLCISGAIWAVTIVGHSVFPGSNIFPLLMRSIILVVALIISYYLNYRFCKKNLLMVEILKLKSTTIKYCLGAILLGFLLITAIWSVVCLISPFEIVKNPFSKVNLMSDIVSFAAGNTLEELIFRGFALLASVKLFGKTGGVLFVSLLFGIFHLQGTGLTVNGLVMVMTTFTMSLLFISVIYYTRSIWPAVILHITGNVLLHSLGFDGTKDGFFEVRFTDSPMNEVFLTLIYEFVVIAFAVVIFIKGKKQL